MMPQALPNGSQNPSKIDPGSLRDPLGHPKVTQRSPKAVEATAGTSKMSPKAVPDTSNTPKSTSWRPKGHPKGQAKPLKIHTGTLFLFSSLPRVLSSSLSLFLCSSLLLFLSSSVPLSIVFDHHVCPPFLLCGPRRLRSTRGSSSRRISCTAGVRSTLTYAPTSLCFRMP